MLNRFCGLILLCALAISLIPAAAAAQSALTARLAPPSTEAFPRIETTLDLRDGQGKFMHGLQAADVRLLEDGSSIPISELAEQRTGVQVVVVLSPGPSFAVRNLKGVSRFDLLLEGLRGWAKSRQGTTIDDLSLLITNGPEVSHVTNSLEWAPALDQQEIDPRDAQPSLDTLFRAVEIAADPSPRPGMGRVVLFITPPIEGDTAEPMENVVSRANELGVRISVWMVASAGSFPAQAGEQLEALAARTGGRFLTYTGNEATPIPEDDLEPFRTVYRLAYPSQIKSTGQHQLSAEIQAGGEVVTTTVQSFNLDIQPPNPVFITPPLTIERKPAEKKALASSDQEGAADYEPKEQVLPILIDFPDGRVRPLKRTALYVDGMLAVENTEPPYDQFVWDLTPYAEAGQHSIKVEAEDSLGMVGNSIDTVVQVSIRQPAASPIGKLSGRTPVLAGLVAVVAGSVLLLVLVLGGRIRPQTQRARGKKARRKGDPVTQPVPARIEPPSRRLPNWVNRLQWPQRHVAPKVYAFLARISETDSGFSQTPIPITADEITLGSDPSQATLVLNDPSVEALHARLIRKEDDTFRLADEGSIAGTWINYTPVSREGMQLEHGDLVHIGRVGFRFTLRQPGRIRRPVVTAQETHEEASQ